MVEAKEIRDDNTTDSEVPIPISQIQGAIFQDTSQDANTIGGVKEAGCSGCSGSCN